LVPMPQVQSRFFAGCFGSKCLCFFLKRNESLIALQFPSTIFS
jgi:hypothetical protein